MGQEPSSAAWPFWPSAVQLLARPPPWYSSNEQTGKLGERKENLRASEVHIYSDCVGTDEGEKAGSDRHRWRKCCYFRMRPRVQDMMVRGVG